MELNQWGIFQPAGVKGKKTPFTAAILDRNIWVNTDVFSNSAKVLFRSG